MNDYEFWKDLDKIFEAIVAYQEKTIEFNKQFINPWVKLGNVFDKKENNEAIAAHKNAVEIAPENAQNWFELAKAYTQSGNFNQAIQAYQQARKLGVDSGELYKNLGMAYAMTSRYQEAIPVLRHALERSENEKEKAVIWNHLGNVYRKLNNYQMAFQAFQKADQIEGVTSSNLEGNFSVGSNEEPSGPLHTQEEEPDTLRTAREAHPLFGDISNLEKEARNVEDSDPDLEQGNDLDSEEQGDFFQSSSTLEDEKSDALGEEWPVILEMDFTTLEDYLEAENPRVEDSVQKGASVDPSTEEDESAAFAGEQLKTSHQAAEKDMEPDAEYKTRFTFSAYEEFLQDTVEPIRKNLIEDQLEEEEVTNAALEANQLAHSPFYPLESSADLAGDMETKNAQIWNELGNVYFNAGALDDAIAAYIKAVELDTLFAWPYTNLAMAYVQKGRFEEAVLLYQRSIELFSEENDKAITWNRLGDLYRRLEEYEKAIAAYQRADDLNPGNPGLFNQTKLSLLGSEKTFQGIGSPL